MPRGVDGKFTLTRGSDASGRRVASTRRIQGLSGSKSGSSPDGAESAIPRRPSNAACFAAASVPECQMELPRFKPRLTPERTTSTLSQLWVPSATQSAGVPLTR